MRVNIRNKKLLSTFTEKLDQARSKRRSLLEELLGRMSLVESELASMGARLLEGLESSRLPQPGMTWSVQWAWRSHKNAGKVMPIEVYLVVEDQRGDKVSQQRLSLRLREARVERLQPLIGLRAAKQFSRDLDRFLVLANTVVRWINVLAADEAPKLNLASWNYGLKRWISLTGGLCETAALRLAGMVEEFLELDAELDELVFEFNGAAQPVRFHSIICRRDCPPFDLLAPAAPRFRVVVSLNRATGRRNSRDVQMYKTELAVARLAAELHREMGREPELDEVRAARDGQRKRSPSPWLTAELIQHCWLGKRSAGLLRQQKRMVAVMDQWQTLRSSIQSLL